MKRGDKVIALSRGGQRFTARVVTAHRNGDATVKFQWARDKYDAEVPVYDGACYRVPATSIETAATLRAKADKIVADSVNLPHAEAAFVASKALSLVTLADYLDGRS